MKTFSLLLSLAILFPYLPALGEAPDPEEIREFFWGEDGLYQQDYEIPEKWQDESAVILGLEVFYKFRKEGRKIDYEEGFHLRIKLNNQTEVEEFSEFSYLNGKFEGSRGSSRLWKKPRMYFGIKLIKPDRQETIIDLEQSVQVEGLFEREKVAIPGLEVGDILDFYYYLYEPFRTSAATYIFDPVVDIVGGEYPISDMQLNLLVDRKLYANFKSLNGAPEPVFLREGKVGNLYEFKVKDVEKLEDYRWLDGYRALPAFKFQVSYVQSGVYAPWLGMLGATGSLNSHANTHDIRTAFQSGMFSRGVVKRNREYKYAKRLKKDLQPLELIEALYYTERLRKTMDGSSDNAFFTRFTGLLALHGFDAELLAVPNKYATDMEDLLFPSELSYLLKVNLPNDTNALYFSAPHPFMLPGEIGDYQQGQDYIPVEHFRGETYPAAKGRERIERVPVLPAQKNMEITQTKARISDALDEIHLEATKTATGGEKAWLQANFWTTKGDFPLREKERVREMYFGPKGDKYFRKHLDLSSYEAPGDEGVEETALEWLNNRLSLELEELEEIEVESLGATPEEPDFICHYALSSSDFIKPAGPNYLLEVGRLIGGQVALDEEELDERPYDIHFDQAREYRDEISLEIPEGYSVQGLESLQYKVENEAGRFVSNAKVEGNRLLIITTKTYRHQEEPAENWPLLVEFLEAAYDFTQQKVLLKKK